MQSFLLLILGLILTSVTCIIINLTIGLAYAISLFVLYLFLLAIILRSNNAKMQTLMQSYIICISAILYLENYNVFHPLGIRVQMGHLGNWLEVRRWRAKNS